MVLASLTLPLRGLAWNVSFHKLYLLQNYPSLQQRSIDTILVYMYTMLNERQARSGALFQYSGFSGAKIPGFQ